MSNNTKIILNRVKKGKKLSLEEETVLLNQIDNGPFTLEYAAIYREKRWIEFEESLKDYCKRFGGLFTINEFYLMLYITNKLKGPWFEIQKYFIGDIKQKYFKFLNENGFEEYTI
jgi:hypothetical protein